MRKNNQKKALVLVLLWPVVATLLSFLFEANYLVSILLFFGLPSLYLSYINPKFVKKLTLYSLIFAVPAGIILDYMAVMSGTWFMPVSVFDPFRIFGLIVLENMLWVFLWTYFIVIFYETFLDEDCTAKLYYPRLKYLFVALLIFVIGVISVHFIDPLILKFDFGYLKVGIVTVIIPIAFLLFKSPNIYLKLVKMGAYFFTLSLLHEITGLSLNQWTFPAEDQFVGWISLGSVNFPVEEFLFFMVLGSLAIVSFYEIFDDDGK